MRAADTNVLVRVLARDDEKQVRAAEEFIGRGAWVSHLVLAEAVWVLATAYGFTREDIETAVSMLVEHQHFTLQEADVVVAALQLYRRRPALGFSDCLILEIARKAGHLPLGTFDRSLSRFDGAELL